MPPLPPSLNMGKEQLIVFRGSSGSAAAPMTFLAMQRAVEADDVKKLDQLLDNKGGVVDINRVWTDGALVTNLISFAAKRGGLHCLLLLLCYDDVMINRPLELYYSPLERAVDAGHDKCTQALLKTKGVKMHNSLKIACEKRRPSIVRRLLIAFPVDDFDSRSQIKVSMEICTDVECAAELMADARCPTSLALPISARNGWASTVEHLLRRSDVNVNGRSAEGFTSLMLAAKFGHKNVLQLLLAQSTVDVMAESSLSGKSALQLAQENDKTECVNLLATKVEQIAKRKASANGESSMRCVICMTAAVSRMITPCNHLCLCASCTLPVDHRRCPVCRGGVGGVIKVFMP